MMVNERSTSWRYRVCGLLLLATMLNYMDRLTLSQLGTTIRHEYSLSHEQYGMLDTGFSYAFALGAIFFGFLVDRVGPRFLYPSVFLGWSAAGVATAFAQPIGAWFIPETVHSLPETLSATLMGLTGSPGGGGPLLAATTLFPGRTQVSEQAYLGFMLCRVTLGFFEAGHWPCALVTTHIMLSRADRSLGNSILQSGAAFGSILTPIVVTSMRTSELGGWRLPFVAIGFIGMLWIIPWLAMIRSGDLERKPADANAPDAADHGPKLWSREFWQMLAVLAAIVISINLTWQYFRVWLPMYLEETHHYAKKHVDWFTSAYYLSTDIGCIGVGFLVKWLIGRGWGVHQARRITFTAAAALTLLAVVVAFLPTGPVLLGVLLLVGAGSLGLYPNYYSFAQELSRKHQGKVSGALGTIAWIGSGTMQRLVGRNIDETKSYVTGIVLAGLVPLIACAALWLFWPERRPSEQAAPPPP
ncbi:MAG: MFS transporter [Planctomycetes bacterium]|jgi:MFS family permease|nr:MFS transporter [Planctomycetota bacterium]